MIVVVGDTSPLNYLVQIHCQELLPALYERLLIPRAVFEELTDTRTPAAVRGWASHPPEWLELRGVQSALDAALAGLGSGEREAIQLAQEEHADLLLMDERAGVNLARRRGLAVTGTLGVLIHAARRGLVNIDSALSRLEVTDFRCTPHLLEQVKQKLEEKRRERR
jgi:predicted nucleic acid-binding protein